MKKDSLILIISFIIIILIFFIFTILFTEIMDYSNYKGYYKEGYDVKLDFDWDFLYTCKIKVEMQDGLYSWNNCNNIGDEYSWENFAVKRN